jgi:putative transposase
VNLPLRTLRKYSIVASVSRPGNPGDNCESFFRTLKREEIRATQYANVEDLRTKISRFIDYYYNRKRLHSALGYRSPAEFEKVAISVGTAGISSVIELDS